MLPTCQITSCNVNEPLVQCDLIAHKAVFVYLGYRFYLVYEDGATQAPPPGLTGLVEGAVIGNYHHVDSDAVVTGLFGSQSKVQAVTGVVLHDEKDPGSSWRRG